uniref:Uncharacterized protein n=1 Tax=Rhizophora mucronata TaxID=61149 RepID=A0A2P2NPG2_RHIMU
MDAVAATLYQFNFLFFCVLVSQ